MSRGGARPGAGRKKVTLSETISARTFNWRNPTHRDRLEEEDVVYDPALFCPRCNSVLELLEELARVQLYYRRDVHSRETASHWAKSFQTCVRTLHEGDDAA